MRRVCQSMAMALTLMFAGAGGAFAQAVFTPKTLSAESKTCIEIYRLSNGRPASWPLYSPCSTTGTPLMSRYSMPSLY